VNTKWNQILALLGFDIDSNEIKVLRAIMSSQEELGSGCTFNVLQSQLRDILGGKKMSRPLIYRYLKSLEDTGILVVNRTVNPNLYVVTFESVFRTLNRAKLLSTSKLNEESEAIQHQYDTLHNTDWSWLAKRLHFQLVGEVEKTTTKAATGLQNAQYLIDNEIYSKAVEGDTLRITVDWTNGSEREELMRQAIGLQLLAKGVKIRVLQYSPEDTPEEILRLRYERLKDSKENDISIGFKIARRNARTYQGVCINRDSYALVVSEAPVTVVWLPRSANAPLIDEAVKSFDRDYQEGIDYLDYFGGRFHEQRE
jgi:hypothetical protein